MSCIGARARSGLRLDSCSSVSESPKAVRLLLVEDEYLNALYVTELLKPWAIEPVGPSATVDDALDLLDHARPDAALLDVNLQGEPVFPVAERLRTLGVPFAFASGYDRDMLPEAWRDVPLCLKPIDPDRLREVLVQLLGRDPTGQ